MWLNRSLGSLTLIVAASIGRGMNMSTLSREIAAYEGMQKELEIDFLGMWALVHDETLIGTFDSFEEPAAYAVTNFGRGPYLIRKIGSTLPTLPVSTIVEK